MYLLIYTIWILLNGQITLEICLLGVGVTAAVGILVYALFGYTLKKDLSILKRVPLFFVYLLALIVEIFKANLSVMKIILTKAKKIHPYIACFDSGLEHSFSRFVLANSITLTPGTITVKTEGDAFTVHCLDQKMIDDIREGTLYKLLKRMEDM